jgi:hypothetical protein
MTDNSNFLDNDLNTTRVITATAGVQTFANSATDSSYSLDPTDRVDFYRLNVSRSSNVILTLSNLSGDANLELLDYSGTLSEGKSENSGTATEAIVKRGADALDAGGTYYIRVYTSDSSVTANYTLTVNTNSTTRADLLWRNYSTGRNTLWQMNGSQFSNSRNMPTLTNINWQQRGAADFDGDGQADYLWRNPASGQNGIWLMDAFGNIRATTGLPLIADAAWKMIGPGDFNQDGKADILWYNTATGRTDVWLMNGIQFARSSRLPDELDRNWVPEAAGDFNQDQHTDIVWRNVNTGQLRVWLMNQTTYTGVVSIANQPSPGALWNVGGVGDFNGDGHLDVAWRENGGLGRQAIWFLNQTTYRGFTFFGFNLTDLNWQMTGVVNTPPALDLAGNTLGTAFTIGTIALDPAQGITSRALTYQDTSGTTSDPEDYYRFTLAGTNTVKISVSGLPEAVDIQLIQDINNNGVIDQNEIIASETRDTSGSGPIDVIPTRQLAAGSYFIRIRDLAAGSSNYRLNLTVEEFAPLDLQVVTPFNLNRSSLALSSTGTQTVRATYSLRNGGTRPQDNATFRIGFYLSRDNIITTSDKLLTTVTKTLTPGQTLSNQTQDLTIPNATDLWWGADQSYYIGMIIDPPSSGSPTGDFIETDERNNVISRALPVTGTLRPDLEGNGLNVAVVGGGPAAPGKQIQLTGSINNKGNRSTGTSPTDTFLVTFVLSQDDFYGAGDRFLAQAEFKPIASKTIVSFNSNITDRNQPSYFTSSSITLPGLNDWEGWQQGNGRYYIAMQIDFLGQVNEGSEGAIENNVNYGRLTNRYIDYNFIDISGIVL